MMYGEPRSIWSRAGIALLNTVWPGLGLLRLGRARDGIFVSLAVFLCLACYAAISVLPGVLTPASFILAALFAFGVGGLTLTSIVWTWRAGRNRSTARPWFARALAIITIGIVGASVSRLTAFWVRAHYEPFRIPSGSMAPSVVEGDYLYADMRGLEQLARGDVVIVRFGDTDYIKRIAGLGGDRVEMRHGRLIINGDVIPLTRREQVATRLGIGTEYVEKLPGERGSHLIVDAIPNSEGDTYPETVVPPGHVFLLGDNRDDSEDSRFGPEVGGTGSPPVDAVRGRALFIYWSRDRHRVGQPVQ